MVYDYLEEFIYENLTEAEDGISEEKPHYFIKADNEIDQDIKRLEERLKIQMPSELKHFLVNVGSGELFAGLPEEDIDGLFSSKRDLAREYLISYHLLAFVDFSELSYLFISLDEEQGKNAIYYATDTKIASSLEEFVERIIKEPDYFIEDAEMEEE